MTKLYYPTPDEVLGLPGLNELIWFERHQHQFIRYANTDTGRDALCLEKTNNPLIELRKNFARYRTGPQSVRTDFRVGAKWGNIIRSRFREIKADLDRQTLLDIRGWPTIYDKRGKALLPVGGGTTLTAYPEANAGSTTGDANVKQNTINSNWATLHDGGGNNVDNTSATLTCVGIEENNANYFQVIVRGIFTFDTSSISADNIVDATMSLWGTDEVDDMSITPAVNIYASNPADSSDMVAGDYDSLGTTAFSTALTLATWNGAGGYNAFALNASGIAVISKTGITELGTRESNYDVPNSAPTLSGGVNQSFFSCRYADQSGTSNDPKLVINHSAEFTPKVIMF